MSSTHLAIGLLAVLGAFFAACGSARAAEACVVTPGLYQTTWERLTASTRFPATPQDTFEQLTTARIYGDITFDVACDGSFTIKDPTTVAVYRFKSNAIVLGKNVEHTDFTVNVPMQFSPVGKASVGFGNFPTLKVKVQSSGAACPPGVDSLYCPVGHTENWTFKGTRDDSDEKFKMISGNVPFNAASHANGSTMDSGTLYAITHTDQAMPDAAKMNVNKGQNFGASDGYTMVLAATPPDILVSQDVESVFLDHTPALTIELRAHVYSWGGTGAHGKDVTFDFEGKHFDVPAAKMQGSDAIVNIDVGDLDAGNHMAMVAATNLAGQTTKAPPYAIHVIPTPPWARKLDGFSARGLDPTCVTECAYYQGSKKLPSSAIEFGVDIPDIVPFIGGPWGLQSVQFKLTPRPQTRLGPSAGSVSGGGSLGIGGRVFSLAPAVWSNVTTTTTPTELQFTHGNIGFSDQDVNFTKHLSFLEVFASLGDLLPVKGVGNWIRQNDGAGIDVGIGAGVHGSSLQFGAKPTDQDISISKFETQLSVTASVQALVDLKLLGGGVLGLVNGTLDMSLEPSPKIEGCQIKYYLVAVYGSIVTGYSQYPANPQYQPITSCKSDTTASVGPIQQLDDALAAANRVPFFATAQAQTPEPAAPMAMPVRDATTADRVALRTSTTGLPVGRRETTLVDGVPTIVAAPAVATGPHGRIALVWIGENLKAQRPQSWQAQLRLFDGRTWKSTAPFIGDGRPNAMPAVAFDGDGNVVVAYSVNRTKNASASLDASTQFANLQVESVTCDGTTGAVKSRRILSTGRGPHLNAQVVRAGDGSVWAAWETVDTGNIGVQNPKSRIRAAHWDRRGWTAPETVASAMTGVDAWQIAARDGNVVAVAVDTTAAKARSIREFDRGQGGWKQTFAQGAAVVVNPRVAVGYAVDGSPEVLWSDAAAIVREHRGSAQTLIANAGGVPVAIVRDGSVLSTLVRTPNGYRVIRTDDRGKRVGNARAIAPATQTFTAPGVAPVGRDWILAEASVSAPFPPGSLLGGGPLTLTSASPARARRR